MVEIKGTHIKTLYFVTFILQQVAMVIFTPFAVKHEYKKNILESIF